MGAKLRPQEAAAYLGIARSTLDKMRMLNERRGPTFAKLGRCVVYDTDDLDAWVRANKVETKA